MIAIAIGVLLSTVVIQFVAGLLPGVEVEDWVSAFWTALLMALFSNGALYFWQQIDIGSAVAAGWQFYGVLFVLNTVSFGLAAVAIEGIRVHNPISLLLAGAALTGAGYGIQLAAAEVASLAFGV